MLKDYDFIVMDTPPALGILTVNALVASTHLLVPIQAAYFAIEGTDDLLETYGRIRSRPNPDLKMLGRGDHAVRQAHQHFARHARADSLGVWRSAFQDAHQQERPPGGKPGLQGNHLHLRAEIPGAEEYKKLAQEVLQRVEEDRVARHSQDAA